jgi:uncharacterized membrane protein
MEHRPWREPNVARLRFRVQRFRVSFKNPLFPQLAGILRGYGFGPRLQCGGRLLFPLFATGQEAMLVDVRRPSIELPCERGGRPGSSRLGSSATPGRPRGFRRWTVALR